METIRFSFSYLSVLSGDESPSVNMTARKSQAELVPEPCGYMEDEDGKERKNVKL